MNNKKPMDDLTKSKLIMTIEYVIIATLFLVLAILKLCNIFNSSEVKSHIFNIVTLAGGIWIIADFIWASVSKKRRLRIDYLDKIIVLPTSLFLIPFDIFCLVNWNNFDGLKEWYKYGVSGVFIFIFVIYTFLGIWHYIHPSKALLIAVEQDRIEKEKALLEQNKKEVPSEETSNEDKK